jgi:hypothetical protein
MGGDEAIGHQALGQAVEALQQPLLLGVAQGHAEGGFAGQVFRVEAQATAVASSSLWGAQFGQQLRPPPAPPACQKESQADADRVEGRRPQVAAKPLGQDRPPGAEVEQAEDEVEIIQAVPIVSGANVVGGQPGVMGAATAEFPRRDIGESGRAKGEQGANSLPLKGGREVLRQQSSLGSGETAGGGQITARKTDQAMEGAVGHLVRTNPFHGRDQDGTNRRLLPRRCRSQARLRA